MTLYTTPPIYVEDITIVTDIQGTSGEFLLIWNLSPFFGYSLRVPVIDETYFQIRESKTLPISNSGCNVMFVVIIILRFYKMDFVFIDVAICE